MIPEPPTLEPPTPPDMLDIPFTMELWHWGMIVLAVLLLAALSILLTRKKKKPLPPPTAEEIARQKILRLADSNPSLKETATGLSLIFRSYLSGRSEDPALFETQQEFNKRVDSLALLPEHLQMTSRDLLQQMADLKYSSRSSDDSRIASDLVRATLDLIDQIEQHLLNKKGGTDEQDAPKSPQRIPFSDNY